MIRPFNVLLITMLISLIQVTKASEPGNNNTDFGYFVGTPTLFLNQPYNANGQRPSITYQNLEPDYTLGLTIINAQNLNSSTWTPQAVTDSEYGDNIFTLVNKDGWFIRAADLDLFGEHFYVVGVGDFSNITDSISNYPELLWKIEINQTKEDVGYLCYNIESCKYLKYLTTTIYNGSLIAGQLTDTIESGSWWSALISPTRLPAPLLTNALVFNGDEANKGAVYLSITSGNVALIDDNDASTNLWLVNSGNTSISNGFSLLIGNQTLYGSFVGIPCLAYDASGVKSSTYTTYGDESITWSVLPYRYQMYTIQASDGRFLIRSTPQTVELINISDSINLHPEAIWNLLDSDINYTSSDQQTTLNFLDSEANLTCLDGNPDTGDIYATEFGTLCTLDPVLTEISNKSKNYINKSNASKTRIVQRDDSVFIDMLKNPDSYGLSFRKLKKSIIRAFNKTKKIAITAVDESTKTGTVAFINPMATPPIFNGDLWSGAQRGINLFSQINESTGPLGDGILELVGNEGRFIVSTIDKIFHPGRRHLQSTEVTSSNNILAGLRALFKEIKKLLDPSQPYDPVKNPLVSVDPNELAAFYSSNDSLQSSDGGYSYVSNQPNYLTMSETDVTYCNGLAQIGLDGSTIGYTDLYDCDCFTTALNAQAFSWLVTQKNQDLYYGPALGRIGCAYYLSSTNNGSHEYNFFMDKTGKIQIYDPQLSAVVTTKSYITKVYWYAL